MTRFMIYPYKMGSQGAIAIRNALDVEPDSALLIRREGSRYVEREGDCIISWGTIAPFRNALNRNPEIAINKLDFYNRLQHGVIPPYVTSRSGTSHLRFPVLCRTRVEGADGQGIVIAETPEQLVSAPLYVQLMDNQEEWRVHAGRLPDGTITIIGVQKKLHEVVEGVDPRIWTGDSTRLSDRYRVEDAPASVCQVVQRAMQNLPELTFGGFDVVHGSDGSFVVEVNSAPMMTQATANKYADFFRRYVQPVTAPAPEPVVAAEEDPTETADYQAGYAAARAEIRDVIARTGLWEWLNNG